MIASFFYHYGANRNVKIFIGSDDPETRKEFSELCGQKKIKNFSVNTNAENPASASTGAGNQPLITVGMLERLNGDEKGDAIVSVRGYEPIWTKFTPSYQLKQVYFKEGKADLSKREAVLFEKQDYVFDIYARKGQSVEDRMLAAIEEQEKEEKEQEKNREKYLKELDGQWQSIVDDINQKLLKFVEYLDGRDSRAVQSAKLESKATLLYAIMENYPKTTAEKIMGMADYISSKLPLLAELQNKVKR